ncbi:hypothetical protein Metev_1193 [Methanohalobium evestigatum Z-7303]|uniref:Uncharacterized protein n=1 Tax=Methanohalobium evestigatum (strain ATCC BAA-1072 / DSM 3721 / NBRC 107634 / OCM 161 / Z-7303) TaxID=644295 RepID=D7E7J5_METEZ|nr:NosD domain-containing protein [Methanohalobium evestigatum]ADI74068.1 hypothetical protein Metev_1193 [Methanohalobium evestigatum Z-7303]
MITSKYDFKLKETRFTSIITIFLFLIVSLTMVGAVSAATITVDDDGPADYSSIQYAVNNSSDGDIIEVAPGTYSELVYMQERNDLIIRSTNGSEATIIDAKQTGKSPLNSPGTPTHPAFYVMDCNNITIKGFTINDVILDANTNEIYQSTDPYLMTPVLLYSSSNCKVQDNILHNFYYGVFLSGEAGFGPCNDNLITNNKIDGNKLAFFGINLYDDGTVDGMENNIISDNTVQNCYYNIYAGFDAVNTTISGNVVSGSPDLVDYFPSASYTDPPQELDNGYGIKVTGDGLASDGTVGGQLIKGNIVTDCKTGILSNTFNVTVSENIVCNNNNGIGIDDYLHQVTGNEIHYNDIRNNENYGIINIAATDVNATYNWWGSNDGPSGEGPGTGDQVSENVSFEPFLTERVKSANISIEKSTNGVDADTPKGPDVQIGTDVTWMYNVTNTGDIVLYNITLTDSKLGEINCSDTTLDPGESIVCEVTGTAQKGQYSNIANVTGITPCETSVTDTDQSHYFGYDHWAGVPTANPILLVGLLGVAMLLLLRREQK